MIKDVEFYRRIGAMSAKRTEKHCRLCARPYLSTWSGQLFCSLLCKIFSHIEVKAADECWPFQGKSLVRGYGVVSGLRVARFICKMFHGPVLHSQHACHSCDNPVCCNPAHLWPGTPTQNNRDSMSKGRRPKGSMVPTAKLTEECVRIIRNMPFEIISYKEVADLLGCNHSTVRRVALYETWQHV